MVSSNREHAWTPAFTTELLQSLAAFADMHDPDWRLMVLEGTGERLGMSVPFNVPARSDSRDHIFAIVQACRKYRDPPAAVTALVGTIEYFRPNDGALARLQDCQACINGLSTLGAPCLHKVLELIGAIPPERRDFGAYELARQARIEDEGVPVLPSDDLLSAVRKLDSARETAPADVPLVVRFLAILEDALNAQDKAPLAAVVHEIAAGLGLPPGSADVTAAAGGTRPGTAGRRVLRIRLNDVSTPEECRYTIEGAVFDVTADREERIDWCPADEKGFSGKDIDDAGSKFLARATRLIGAIGRVPDSMVEFLLPWPLLGHPVEQWCLDGGDYRIGDRFVVVVRSLDRQRSDTFFGPWQRRWEMLSRPAGAQLACERIGWLHYGNTQIPQRASLLHRVISMNGRHGNLTQWLEMVENYATAGLGLTFAYQHDDLIALHSVQDAFNEGIPVLLWRRDNGDANELECLLENVKLQDLPSQVRSWRRSTASCDDSTGDVRYHMVLLWDDPSNVGDPAKCRLSTPR
jgi:hypothetical protein